MKKPIYSKIKMFFSDECIDELWALYRKNMPSNNHKNRALREILDKHGIKYRFLGPGTNRTAVLIGGTVFKFAFDRWGLQSNRREFAYTESLQPYVVKTYESNELIIAQEYITPMDKIAFHENEQKIKEILGEITQDLIIGDVGFLDKNHLNWGYRPYKDDEFDDADTGEMSDYSQIAILDFGEAYRVSATDVICNSVISDEGDRCNGFLEYNDTYSALVCPKCRKTFSHLDIRRRIDRQDEEKLIDEIRDSTYKLTSKMEYVEVPDPVVEEEKDPLTAFAEAYARGEYNRDDDDDGYDYGDDYLPVSAVSMKDALFPAKPNPILDELWDQHKYKKCEYFDDEFTIAKVFGIPMLLCDMIFHEDPEPEYPDFSHTKEMLPNELDYIRLRHSNMSGFDIVEMGHDIIRHHYGTLMSYVPFDREMNNVEIKEGDIEISEHSMTLREYLRQMRGIPQVQDKLIDEEFIDGFRGVVKETPEEQLAKIAKSLENMPTVDISDISSETEDEIKSGAVHDYANDIDDDDEWMDDPEGEDEYEDGINISCEPVQVAPLGAVVEEETFQLEMDFGDGNIVTADIPVDENDPISHPESICKEEHQEAVQLETDIEDTSTEESNEEGLSDDDDDGPFVTIDICMDDEDDEAEPQELDNIDKAILRWQNETPSDDDDEDEDDDDEIEDDGIERYPIVTVYGILMLFTPETDIDKVADLVSGKRIFTMHVIGKDIEHWEYVKAIATNQKLVGTLMTTNIIGNDLNTRRAKINMENIEWWDGAEMSIDEYKDIMRGHMNRNVTFSKKYIDTYVNTDPIALQKKQLEQESTPTAEEVESDNTSVVVPEPSEKMKELVEELADTNVELKENEQIDVDADDMDPETPNPNNTVDMDELQKEIEELRNEIFNDTEADDYEPDIKENTPIDESDVDSLRAVLADALDEEEEDINRQKSKRYKRNKNNGQ